MACCGRRRAALASGLAIAPGGDAAWYRYQGARVLVVTGRATGRTYRFTPGAALAIDAADARGFGGIPGLAPAREPITRPA